MVNNPFTRPDLKPFPKAEADRGGFTFIGIKESIKISEQKPLFTILPNPTKVSQDVVNYMNYLADFK